MLYDMTHVVRVSFFLFDHYQFWSRQWNGFRRPSQLFSVVPPSQTSAHVGLRWSCAQSHMRSPSSVGQSEAPKVVAHYQLNQSNHRSEGGSVQAHRNLAEALLKQVKTTEKVDLRWVGALNCHTGQEWEASGFFFSLSWFIILTLIVSVTTA